MTSHAYERFTIADIFRKPRNTLAIDEHLVLAAAAIAHASVAFLLWLDVFYAESGFIPEQWWLVLFWLWILWPLSLAIHSAGTLKRVLAVLAIGLTLLAPCIPTALAFTAWEIVGFTF